MANSTRQSGQSTTDLWETVSKIIQAFLPVAVFVWGIYQFNAQQANNAKEEFDRSMFSKTLESYSKITQVVGKITTLSLPRDTVKYDSLKKEFEENYWGSLLLVEQTNVRQALRELKSEINDTREGNGSIENIILRQDHLAEQLRMTLKSYREPR